MAGTVAAFLALNYYFTSPTGSLDVQKEDDLAALVVFVAASAVLGWTVSRLDAARRTAEQRERETHIRLDLTTRLMAGEDPAAVVAGAADALVALFQLVECTVRGPGVTTTATGPGVTGATTSVRIAPLEVEAVASREHPLASSDRALLEALVAGLAAAIDRLRLETEARDARVDAQVGRTRSGFLSAVTHNLRTPLASIKAASSTLRAPDLDLSADDRAELLDTIYDETERLERLVTNILELSRIRAGGLEVRRQPVDLARPRAGRGPAAPAAGPRPPGAARRPAVVGRRRGRRADDGAGLRQPPRERAAVRAARLRDPGVVLPGTDAVPTCRGARRRPRSRGARSGAARGSSRSSHASTRDPTPAAPDSASRSCMRS